MTETENDKVEAPAETFTIEQFLAGASKLSPEERRRAFKEYGLALPCGDVSIRRWGFVCTDCGQIALIFLGEELPDTSQPIESLSWTQEPFKSKDRKRPCCMHCRREIPQKLGVLNDSIDPRIPSLLVEIEEWTQRRDSQKASTKAKLATVKASYGQVAASEFYRAANNLVDVQDSKREIGQVLRKSVEEAAGASFDEVAAELQKIGFDDAIGDAMASKQARIGKKRAD